jgi:hypothetical protein
MPDIAICYWGMSRSTKHVYTSHYEHIFNVLKNAGLTYDTYFHTWDVKVNLIWDEISPVLPDPDEYKLLEPTEYKVESQDVFLNTLTFSDYYDQDAANRNEEWLPYLIRNHLCSLESQKRVTKMMLESGKTYSFVLYVRPDVEIDTPFPFKILPEIGFRCIGIPDFDHWEGYNDRGAILRFEDCTWYANRIDEIKEFRKHHGRIVSEKYVKFIVDKYFKMIPVQFRFTIVRPKA